MQLYEIISDISQQNSGGTGIFVQLEPKTGLMTILIAIIVATKLKYMSLAN